MDGFNPLTGGLLGLMMGQMGQGGFNYPDPYQFVNPMTSYNPYGYQAAQYSYSTQFGTPQSSYQQPADPLDFPGKPKSILFFSIKLTILHFKDSKEVILI